MLFFGSGLAEIECDSPPYGASPDVPDSHTVCGSGAMPPLSDGLRNIWLDAGY